MNKIPELDANRPALELYVKGMADGMKSSALVLNLFTNEFEKGIDSLLQFAVMCMLDKPLFLLVPEGKKIPESVRKIALGIEFYQPDNLASMHNATNKLMALAKEKGFIA